MATLREVAKLAEVSTATVSKVLSNTPYVSEETRARVIQAVRALRYEPNLAARALSKGRTYNIGVIFPFNYDHLFADPHVLAILEGIEAICTGQGYNILLSTPRPPVGESEAYRRLVRSGYLDGAVALETLPGTPVSDLLNEFGYPWVAIGAHSKPDFPNSVQPDDFGGARALAAHIIGLGHRNIGIINVEPGTLAAAEHRIAGYRAAFEEAGLRFEGVPNVFGNFSVESGYEVVGELLAHSPRPTAILCLNDRMAMGAIRRAWAEGLRVPDDVSIAGFDDIASAAVFTPPLTTVRQPAHEMGARAAEMLFELISERIRRRRSKNKTSEHHHEFPRVVLPTELIVRASTSAPDPNRRR